MSDKSTRARIATPGLLLGIGLGGFLDGIVLHQIFQLHNMLSAVVPPDTMANMKTNMLADGLFHLFTWIVTLAGVIALWHALNRTDRAAVSGTALLGYGLAGWGWFNLVEGLASHHLLHLHHVVEARGLSLFDWLFLGSGIALIIVGHGLARAYRDRGA